MVHPEYIMYNIIDIFYVIQDTLPEWSPWDHDVGDVSSLMP